MSMKEFLELMEETAVRQSDETNFVDGFLAELDVQKNDFTEKILAEIKEMEMEPYERAQLKKKREAEEKAKAEQEKAEAEVKSIK